MRLLLYTLHVFVFIFLSFLFALVFVDFTEVAVRIPLYMEKEKKWSSNCYGAGLPEMEKQGGIVYWSARG